jgi:nucleotide-binding universal stress UspA family protein
MSERVPADLAARTHLHLESGDPPAAIAAAAERLDASLVIMGEHTRAPLRRLWSQDTSLAVLRHAHCPVWFVPGCDAAGTVARPA